MGAIVALTALVGAVIALTPIPADAITGSDFDPGYIISDAEFSDSGAMSEAAIQQFLQSKVPNCVGANGYPCLKDATFDTWTRAATSECGVYQGATAEPASRIIVKVAQACGVNPQVLLALLQKEQGLVTSTSPTGWSYTSATGYGCPDTAACDAEYSGFYNQLFKAAWQFKVYGEYPSAFNYHVGSVAIQFNPNTSCGSSLVNIRNQATANLYDYTPYQPNAAALQNLRGTGDGCSAYGNRNFWVFFNDWFGSSTGPNGYRAIAAEYGAQGGQASLGVAVSDVMTIYSNGGGLGQAYAAGSIYWTPTTGALTVRAGQIRDYYFGRSGADGALGWPVANQASIAASGGGVAQAFTLGSIYSSSGGTFSVMDRMRSGYFELGGSAGALGWPTAEQTCDSAVVACTQQFSGGLVVWSAVGGAHALTGPILAGYQTAATSSAPWGAPMSPVLTIDAHNAGVGQVFATGSAYSVGGNTAFIVSGPIRSYYFSTGGAVGSLGYPTGAQLCNGDTSDCSQAFQGGTIHWSASDGAHVISPEIESEFARLGGATGILGPATTGLIRYSFNGGGVAEGFRDGTIYMKPSLGAFAVYGEIRSAYFMQSGAAGAAGWPTGDLTCSGPVCTQPFEKSTIVSSPVGAYSLAGGMLAGYLAAGGSTGSWGVPASGLIAIQQNGGGVAQVFASGSAYARVGKPSFLVSGGVRDYYFSTGGAAGAFGFPTAEETCVVEGCSQNFDGGTIAASARGSFGVTGGIAAAYATAGSATWGWPTSNTAPLSANGGGMAQAFTVGSAYQATGRPAIFVVGGIRDYYFTLSGANGRLGFPLAPQQCNADASSCSQLFQGGTVVWSATDGGLIAP